TGTSAASRLDRMNVKATAEPTYSAIVETSRAERIPATNALSNADRRATGSTPGMARAEPAESPPWVDAKTIRSRTAAGTLSDTSDAVSVVFIFAVRIAPRRAMPNTPPTSREVFVVALAIPDRWG